MGQAGFVDVVDLERAGKRRIYERGVLGRYPSGVPDQPRSGDPAPADDEVVDFRAAVCRGRGDRRAEGIEYQQLCALDG